VPSVYIVYDTFLHINDVIDVLRFFGYFFCENLWIAHWPHQMHHWSCWAELAAAAERLGVSDLVKVCERALVHAVGDNDQHAAALHEWAGDFNLKRLQKHCAGVLLLGD